MFRTPLWQCFRPSGLGCQIRTQPLDELGYPHGYERVQPAHDPAVDADREQPSDRRPEELDRVAQAWRLTGACALPPRVHRTNSSTLS